MHCGMGLAGKANYASRKIPQALAYFRQALAHGEDPRVHAFERWACWMMLGKFECAWMEADRSEPPWKGDIRSPRHLLIRCLRGLGDAIQFLRYVPMLSSRCGRITVQAPHGLHPLVTSIPGVGAVISREAPVDEHLYDCEIECSNLPYAARTTIGTIPDSIRVPGVADPPACVTMLRAACTGSLKTGIVWSAGAWNPTRSIPVELFLSELPQSGIAWISLQRDCGYLPECVQVPANIVNAETGPASLLATAAIIAELDLVITVDTMIAHLAGSLGKPVWTILQHSADWRWMLGSSTPWYPSMRLFRQPLPGDWATALREVRAKLDDFRHAAYLRTIRAQKSA